MAKRGSSTDPDTFEVGDQVRHPKWGVGSILFKSGSGDSAKAIVVFPQQGQKRLLLKYAQLERVQETHESEEDEFGLAEEGTPPAEEAEEQPDQSAVEDAAIGDAPPKAEKSK